MEDWLARLCVRQNAEIVHEYDQSEDARIQKDAITANGWCYGMVVHWFRCKRQYADFWPWVDTPDAEAKFRYTMALQRLAEQPASGSGGLGREVDNDWRSAVLLKPYGLKLEFSSEVIQKSSASSIVTELRCNKATYLTLALRGNGGHVIGVHYSQCYLSFFDPNAGEFAFRRDSTAEFTEWLRWYMTGQGYWETFNRFNIEGFNPS